MEVFGIPLIGGGTKLVDDSYAYEKNMAYKEVRQKYVQLFLTCFFLRTFIRKQIMILRALFWRMLFSVLSFRINGFALTYLQLHKHQQTANRKLFVTYSRELFTHKLQHGLLYTFKLVSFLFLVCL